MRLYVALAAMGLCVGSVLSGGCSPPPCRHGNLLADGELRVAGAGVEPDHSASVVGGKLVERFTRFGKAYRTEHLFRHR